MGIRSGNHEVVPREGVSSEHHSNDWSIPKREI
jgi:hypothetical protein